MKTVVDDEDEDHVLQLRNRFDNGKVPSALKSATSSSRRRRNVKGKSIGSLWDPRAEKETGVKVQAGAEAPIGSVPSTNHAVKLKRVSRISPGVPAAFAGVVSAASERFGGLIGGNSNSRRPPVKFDEFGEPVVLFDRFEPDGSPGSLVKRRLHHVTAGVKAAIGYPPEASAEDVESAQQKPEKCEVRAGHGVHSKRGDAVSESLVLHEPPPQEQERRYGGDGPGKKTHVVGAKLGKHPPLQSYSEGGNLVAKKVVQPRVSPKSVSPQPSSSALRHQLQYKSPADLKELKARLVEDLEPSTFVGSKTESEPGSAGSSPSVPTRPVAGPWALPAPPVSLRKGSSLDDSALPQSHRNAVPRRHPTADDNTLIQKPKEGKRRSTPFDRRRRFETPPTIFSESRQRLFPITPAQKQFTPTTNAPLSVAKQPESVDLSEELQVIRQLKDKTDRDRAADQEAIRELRQSMTDVQRLVSSDQPSSSSRDFTSIPCKSSPPAVVSPPSGKVQVFGAQQSKTSGAILEAMASLIASQEEARVAHEKEIGMLRESMMALRETVVDLKARDSRSRVGNAPQPRGNLHDALDDDEVVVVPRFPRPFTPNAPTRNRVDLDPQEEVQQQEIPVVGEHFQAETGSAFVLSSLRSSVESLSRSSQQEQEPLEFVRFRVQFGEGAIGMSFNELDGNMVVTRAEAQGAAMAAGVAEGDCIVEVNGFVLPGSFAEDALYELLVEQPRPLTIGFQRPIFEDGTDVDSDSEGEGYGETRYSATFPDDEEDDAATPVEYVLPSSSENQVQLTPKCVLGVDQQVGNYKHEPREIKSMAVLIKSPDKNNW